MHFILGLMLFFFSAIHLNAQSKSNTHGADVIMIDPSQVRLVGQSDAYASLPLDEQFHGESSNDFRVEPSNYSNPAPSAPPAPINSRSPLHVKQPWENTISSTPVAVPLSSTASYTELEMGNAHRLLRIGDDSDGQQVPWRQAAREECNKCYHTWSQCCICNAISQYGTSLRDCVVGGYSSLRTCQLFDRRFCLTNTCRFVDVLEYCMPRVAQVLLTGILLTLPPAGFAGAILLSKNFNQLSHDAQSGVMLLYIVSITGGVFETIWLSDQYNQCRRNYDPRHG